VISKWNEGQSDGQLLKEVMMRNNSLVPKPWWQVYLVLIPGLIFLLRQVSSPAPAFAEALQYLMMGGIIILSIGSLVVVIKRRDFFSIPVWGYIPFGLLAGIGLMELPYSLGRYLAFLLLLIIGLLFAKYGGLIAGLFILAGGIVLVSYYVEPVIYFWDSPTWKTLVNEGMTVLFYIISPFLLLRSRTVYEQAASLILPLIVYLIIVVFALGRVAGLTITGAIQTVSPMIMLLVTITIAIFLYNFISTGDHPAGYP
jgi:hypothetical protein